MPGRDVPLREDRWVCDGCRLAMGVRMMDGYSLCEECWQMRMARIYSELYGNAGR
jgi:hypothetical protein